VDGSVNGVAVLVQNGARAFRLLQTGLVQNYLMVMAVGVFFFSPLYLVFICVWVCPAARTRGKGVRFWGIVSSTRRTFSSTLRGRPTFCRLLPICRSWAP